MGGLKLVEGLMDDEPGQIYIQGTWKALRIFGKTDGDCLNAPDLEVKGQLPDEIAVGAVMLEHFRPELRPSFRAGFEALDLPGGVE